MRITKLRTRVGYLLTSLLSLGSLSIPASVHATPNCSSGSVVNIVAHEDDDLFFVNPKVRQDIDAGKCVESIFLTSGEGDRTYRAPYAASREAGIVAAYKQMTGTSTASSQDITVASHTVTQYTFSSAPNISLIFMHLPDGGDTSANSGYTLRKLWDGTISSAATFTSGLPSYTKQQLVDVLHSRMTTRLPDTVRTLDYTLPYDDGTDHSDHIATALFAQQASQDYNGTHQLIGYKGYPMESGSYANNVTGTDLTNKQNAYMTYDPYDYKDEGGSNCNGSVSTCPTDFISRFNKNYTSGSQSIGSHQYETLDGSGSDQGKTPTAVQYYNDLWTFYYDSTNGNLRFAKANSSTPTSWTTGTLDNSSNDVGLYANAMVLDNGATNKVLHVFYYDATAGNLKHAWLTSSTGTWQYENLDGDPGSRAGYNAKVGLMPVATQYGTGIQLFYQDDDTKNLRHAWGDGTNWNFENLDGDSGSVLHNATDTGYDPAVTVYQGTLQLFYYDNTGGNLRHVWADGTGWHQENLDGDATTSGRLNTNLGLNPSVTTYDSGSMLQLAYYDQTNGNLRHAWSDANGWHFENLDGTILSAGKRDGTVGATPTITADGSNLHIFAYDTGRHQLRHYWTNTSQPWQAETLDGAGDDSSLGASSSDTGEDPVAIPFASKLDVFYYQRGSSDLRHTTL